MSRPPLTGECWLLLRPRERNRWRLGDLHVQAFQKKPTVPPGCVAVQVNLKVPCEWFEQPQLKVSIALQKPDDAPTVDLSAVQEAVKAATGFEVRLVEQE